jgi:hypothetical protein
MPVNSMKIYEHRKANQLVSFEIGNIGRSRACRIVQKLFPSTVINRQHGDEFCTFRVNGKTFVLEEPFGDNSRYLVYEQPPQPSAELEALKQAFAGYGASWTFSGDKSFRVIMEVLALIIAGVVVAVIVLSR